MTVDTAERRRTLRRILILLGCFFVFVQINRQSGGILANYLGTERGLSSTDIGTIMGAMFFASAVVQLPTGLLFDRIGARRTLVFMGFVAVLGIALFAVAEHPMALVAGRFLIGVGHGGVISGVFLIAVAWAPPERVGQATASVVGIAGGIGGILATTPLELVMGRAGFDVTFLGVAAATAVLTAVIWILVPEAPDDAAARAGGPRRESVAESLRGLIEVIRMPELRRIFAMGVCFTAPFMTVGGLWAGPYFREVQGLTAGEAAWGLLLLVLALHVGTYAYGPLDRLMAGSRRRLVLLGVAIELVCLGVLAAWPAAPLWVAGPVLVLFGCAAPFYVVLAAHARSFVPEHRVGRTLTTINLAGLIGVFVLQTGTGMLIDAVAAAGGTPETGYRLVFLAVMATLAVTAAVYARQPDAPTT